MCSSGTRPAPPARGTRDAVLQKSTKTALCLEIIKVCSLQTKETALGASNSEARPGSNAPHNKPTEQGADCPGGRSVFSRTCQPPFRKCSLVIGNSKIGLGLVWPHCEHGKIGLSTVWPCCGHGPLRICFHPLFCSDVEIEPLNQSLYTTAYF